jgi:hypothetical protein
VFIEEFMTEFKQDASMAKMAELTLVRLPDIFKRIRTGSSGLIVAKAVYELFGDRARI